MPSKHPDLPQAPRRCHRCRDRVRHASRRRQFGAAALAACWLLECDAMKRERIVLFQAMLAMTILGGCGSGSSLASLLALLAAAAAAALVPGCKDDSGGDGPDARADVALEVPGDGPADVSLDGAGDARTDVAPDASPDMPAGFGRCLVASEIALSLPRSVDAGGGWQLCCLEGQSRLCPPTPMAACNYGFFTVFCGDVCFQGDAGACPVDAGTQ
jgi:hypothetical protein